MRNFQTLLISHWESEKNYNRNTNISAYFISCLETCNTVSYISWIQKFSSQDEQNLRFLNSFFSSSAKIWSKTSISINRPLPSFLCYCCMNCSVIMNSWLLLPLPHAHLLSPHPKQQFSFAGDSHQLLSSENTFRIVTLLETCWRMLLYSYFKRLPFPLPAKWSNSEFFAAFSNLQLIFNLLLFFL